MIIVRKWIVCGPFPYSTLTGEGLESFYVDYLEEIGGEARAVLKHGMIIGDARCIEVEADERGFVDLVKIYGEVFEKFWRLRYGVAYAYAEVEVDKEDIYVLLAGSEDYITVYINGEHVFTSHIARRYTESYYAIPMKLMKGVNRVLVKIGRLAGRWGFSIKIDYTDKPLYVNRERLVLPEPPKGSYVAEWVALHILALRDARFRVRCVEDDTWYSCESEETELHNGERTQIPLFIMSKKPLNQPSELRLLINVDGLEIYTYKIEVRPSENTLHRVHTYRSRYDGSVHRYGVKVPVGYDPSKSYAAVIILHGFKGVPMYTTIFGDKDWCISIAPTAREGEINYREIGLLEVLEVLEDTKKRYSIDEDKVNLMGHSMGGYGTWYIGARKPDIFGSIAPHSSRGNLASTINTLSRVAGWEGIAKLINKYNPAAFIENLIATPIYIAHGSEDDIVPVEFSREMAKILEFLGYRYIYEEISGKKHWWGEYKPGSYYGAEAVDRPQLDNFLKNARREHPKNVVAVTDDIRFNRYWWVIVKELKQADIARLDVEIVDRNRIRVNSISNVISFSIDFEELCRRSYIDCRNFVTIIFGESILYLPPHMLSKETVISVDSNGRLCGYSEANGIEVCSDKNVRVNIYRKRTKPSKNILPGPFMDLFNGRVAIAYCSDSQYIEVCRKAALHLQYWWLDYANGVAKVYSDKEAIKLKAHEKFNVIAIGGPEVNSYVETVASSIKTVKIVDERIVVRGRRYCGKEFGIAFIYPNPLADFERYLAILGSNSREAIEALIRLEPTMVPDYIVYNSRSLGVRFNGVVESGFFNINWE
jgi:dienelactone hydrolase